MKILIDADACPNPIKEIIFKSSLRLEIQVILVSNHWLKIPISKFVTLHKVERGFDVADEYIVNVLNENDIVITADIQLADKVLAKKAMAMTPHGEVFTHATIKERLTMRNFMESLRDIGIQTSGKNAFSQKDKQNFANALDSILANSCK